VLFDGSRVVRYDKRHPTPDMKFIDYGLGVLSSDLFKTASDEVFDLSDLYADLAGKGMLTGFEEVQRFYEIGTPSGLAEADSHLRGNL
jgi:NDP-sugar pyrophosphorylase family protein